MIAELAGLTDADLDTLFADAVADEVAGRLEEALASLIIAIAAVAALCAVGGVAAAWRRWPELARAPLRLIRR